MKFRTLLVTGAAALMGGASPAAAQDFCAMIKQAIQSAPHRFEAMKRPGDTTKCGGWSCTYSARALPESYGCTLQQFGHGRAAHGANYICDLLRPGNKTAAGVRTAHRRNVARLRKCLPGIGAVAETAGDLFESVTWQLGPNLKLVAAKAEVRTEVNKEIYAVIRFEMTVQRRSRSR